MKENILYLECFSGISGDMTVAALLDLGVDFQTLKQSLDSLNLEGYEISQSRLTKCGIDACHFQVKLEDTSPPSNHSHHDHSHHDHSHHHHSHHHHSHHHHSHHSHHDHLHRNLSDVLEIINHSGISDKAKALSHKMFSYVARAEAKAHGLPIEKVHFHEVGAVDSIVDIVAVSVCIDLLNIEKVVISTIYEGQGYVKCQHGVIPVPVPAVVNIAQEAGISLRITENPEEMVTPTGMAIAASLKTEVELPSPMNILRVGLGAGKKDFPQANILRAMMVEDGSKVAENPKNNHNLEDLICLETNVDDSSAEALGFVMEQLFSEGAKDVYFTHIVMKKSRPAVKVTVLCEENQIPSMEDVLFTHLTTIGIRRFPCTRHALPREMRDFSTSLGVFPVKVVSHHDKVYGYPEYEPIKNYCLEKNLPFESTFSQIKGEIMSILTQGNL